METAKKVWLVTGSGNGLGRKIVEVALNAGHHVVATARDISQLDDLSAKHGEQVLTAALDVTDEEQAKDVVRLAVDHFGRIDVLINNAGYGDRRPFEQIPSNEFRTLIETCFFGVVTLTREVLPLMRKQRSGHIIQISSTGGRMATAGNSAYYAAKWAIGGFTESLSQETASFGVKVTALEPGGMRTNWGKRASSIPVDLLADYEPSVGAIGKSLESYWGNENSDPVKVAEIILRISNADELPAHILVGSDAYKFAKQASEKRWREAEEWKVMTEYADFESMAIIPEYFHAKESV